MNKLQLAILLLLSLTSLGYSQSTKSLETDYNFTKGKTTFGVKVGLNQSYISVQNNTDGYQGLEAYGGFFAETRLSKKWSFQNELLFSFTDDYHFIEVPVLLKYHINDKFSIFAGPKLDFLINEQSVGERLNPFGVSLELGAQYNFSKRFFVEVRYGYGLTEQINIENFYSGARRTLRLGIGFKF